ncbi:MAG: TolC family protein [Chitinophagaceae bacterium]
MVKHFKYIVLSLLIANQSMAQDIQNLTLEKAYGLSEKNYPVTKQTALVQQTAAINIDNLSKGYLPQFTFSGQATYQSDVTSIPVTIPGFNIESPSKDQYKLLADVNQVVYDGGVIKQQKVAQQLNAQVEEQKVAVELYKVKERVNQIYLSILFMDEQLKQVSLIKDDIQTGIKRVEAQVNNGVAFRSNLNVLKAESLKTDQRAIELKAGRKGLIETLALFLGQPLNENTVFEKPTVTSFALQGDITRPELKLYESQTKLIAQQNSLIKTKNLPKASLFVQGGYGRPALNLLNNDFDFYYIGGVRFSWSLAGLYTKKKEKELVEVNKHIVDIQKETFLLNTNTQLKQQQSEVQKLQQLVATDNDIIDLRVQVKDAAKSQLENGVITANDFLREVNAEDQARQTRITHQLQLLQAQINYQTISGKQ